MTLRKWLPELASLLLVVVLSVFAGLADWGVIALYGILVAGIVTWAVLLEATEGEPRAPWER